MKSHWNRSDIPSLAGKTAVVTGANSGLGYEITLALAAAGAHIVLACRDRAKTDAAIAQVRAQVPQAQLEFLALDLGDLASIRSFAQGYLARHSSLDLLCNNAGVMALPLRQTRDGFEMQIGTNHLGHFALTGLLLPALQATPGARIATMSSNYHKSGRMRFDDLNWQRGPYEKWDAYAQSKLANLLFAFELQRRLQQRGSAAISVAAHPGYSATNLQLAGPEMEKSLLGGLFMRLANRFVAQSPAQGALPMLCALTSPEVQGGDYLGPDGHKEMRGHPMKAQPTAQARDTQAAQRLWELSEQLTGVACAF